ncbi:MAG: glycolate oxidase binding subunit [Actinomycetota bacterium]|nr:glycolate oxidase binding subunit [Actinomycetota bacterium]
MDLTTAPIDVTSLCDAIAAASVVIPVGARTQWEVGGLPHASGTEVRAPCGIVAYDPADLTVTVGCGTPVRDLEAVLGEHGQECGLDPRDDAATVGGVLATGLSGPRRLRYGPLRDTVLEVRFVTGDGRLVKGGGPTVKNVTGYDLPRLLVGSFGSLGVLTQVTLRCRPRPAEHTWFVSDRPAADLIGALYRPSCVASDGTRAYVLLEGHGVDVATQSEGASLSATTPVSLPVGAHRGRLAVAPARLDAVGRALGAIDGCRWLAEYGVGTVHVAGDDAAVLIAARGVAHAHGGWLLREAGGDDGFDGFGVALPNPDLHRRIKEAFDPEGKCNPGRLPT